MSARTVEISRFAKWSRKWSKRFLLIINGLVEVVKSGQKWSKVVKALRAKSGQVVKHPLGLTTLTNAPGFVTSQRMEKGSEKGRAICKTKEKAARCGGRSIHSGTIRGWRSFFEVADGKLHHAPEHQGRRRDHDHKASGEKDEIGQRRTSAKRPVLM
jgi:hypothetical protein